MIFGAVDDTVYNIFLVLHVLTVIGAFAPLVAHPVMTRQLGGLEPGARQEVLGHIARNSQRIYGSSLIVTGILGFGLSGMSEDVYSLDPHGAVNRVRGSRSRARRSSCAACCG